MPDTPPTQSTPSSTSTPGTASTPSTQKSAIKSDQYVPQGKSGQPSIEKADQIAATKTARPATVKTDQPVHRLMTVTITIDAESAEVVRVEGVDATGARHELSDDEKASFIKERRDERVADLVEQAFEAGIASVLGVGDEEEEKTEESSADVEFRRQLLAPLLERSGLGNLRERPAVKRAILGTLIEHSMK